MLEEIRKNKRGRKLSTLISYDTEKWSDDCCERGGPVTVKFFKADVGVIVVDVPIRREQKLMK
ncbi:hypothetical protein T11_6566 [Trichinella zimbabwensis]|uniref:Uncharacterized protein n=1 Tax=Trichinella zimbabwensis TaxID=268475 RepID=A0A0V1GV41_9BILA|nr:hypothetical protein T11_6566 [Trichinella zimbabwensis]